MNWIYISLFLILGWIFWSKNLWRNIKCFIIWKSKCTCRWNYSSNNTTFCISCINGWWFRWRTLYEYKFSISNKSTTKKTLKLNIYLHACVCILFFCCCIRASVYIKYKYFFLSVVFSQSPFIYVFRLSFFFEFLIWRECMSLMMK